MTPSEQLSQGLLGTPSFPFAHILMFQRIKLALAVLFARSPEAASNAPAVMQEDPDRLMPERDDLFRYVNHPRYGKFARWLISLEDAFTATGLEGRGNYFLGVEIRWHLQEIPRGQDELVLTVYGNQRDGFARDIPFVTVTESQIEELAFGSDDRNAQAVEAIENFTLRLMGTPANGKWSMVSHFFTPHHLVNYLCDAEQYRAIRLKLPTVATAEEHMIVSLQHRKDSSEMKIEFNYAAIGLK